jgi:tripartite-type tricarboxylate transporter receptor subunit TctC
MSAARRFLFRAMAAVATMLACGGLSDAQTADDFYAHHVLTYYLGTSAGGSWDVYLRVLMEHLADHLPGRPKIVLEYMPGAGGVRLLNFMANVAPRDGSAIATPLPTSLLSAALDPLHSHFSPPKFAWIGSMARIQDVISVRSSAPVKTIADARRIETKMGVTGVGSNTYFDIAIANALLHTRFKPVLGYQGSSDLDLAIERGELDGRADTWDDWTTSHPQWIARGEIRQLLQIGVSKLPAIGGAPLFSDLVGNADDKRLLNFLSVGIAVGRPLFAPPGAPPVRVAALRQAFVATMRDPAYIADAQRSRLSVGDWTSGEQIQRMVEDDFNAPTDLVRRAQAVTSLQ